MRAAPLFLVALSPCARRATSQPPARAAAFACDAPAGDVGSCTYADARGRVRIVDSLANLRRVYVADRDTWRLLPRFWGSTLWNYCEMPTDDAGAPRRGRVVIADFDGDGRDDIAVVADCVTGVGRRGAEPFPVGTLYLQTVAGRYSVDDERDRAFTRALSAVCNDVSCRVIPAARTAVRTFRTSATRAGSRTAVR